nr:hypothetical protein [Bacteroidota bacterium]
MGSTATGLNKARMVTIRDNNGCTATQEYNITENTAIATIPSQTAMICHGGTSVLTVNSTGGAGGYT